MRNLALIFSVFFVVVFFSGCGASKVNQMQIAKVDKKEYKKLPIYMLGLYSAEYKYDRDKALPHSSFRKAYVTQYADFRSALLKYNILNVAKYGKKLGYKYFKILQKTSINNNIAGFPINNLDDLDNYCYPNLKRVSKAKYKFVETELNIRKCKGQTGFLKILYIKERNFNDIAWSIESVLTKEDEIVKLFKIFYIGKKGTLPEVKIFNTKKSG